MGLDKRGRLRLQPSEAHPADVSERLLALGDSLSRVSRQLEPGFLDGRRREVRVCLRIEARSVH